MRKRQRLNLFVSLGFIIGLLGAIDCPPDTAYHIDMRTQLPDGTPNPQYGQLIPTGLCACVDFYEFLEVTDSTLTLTVKMVDNEPIFGLQMDIYHYSPDLLVYADFGSVARGEKLENVTDENGMPKTITLLANQIGDYVRVMAYSTSGARTAGDSTEGDLFNLTYSIPGGYTSLPDSLEFGIGLCILPGRSMYPEYVNVICLYPDTINPVMLAVPSLGLETLSVLPSEYRLAQNFPNPFNPNTRIVFDIPVVEQVSLTIYNLLGQQVTTLVNKNLDPARYQVVWNGTDDYGINVASGIYFYELRSGSFFARRKMLLLR